MNHGNWESKSRHRVPFSRFLSSSKILQRGWCDSRAISDHTPGPNVRMGTTACPSYGVSSRGPGTTKPSIEIPATITRYQLIPHHLPSLLSAYSNAVPQHLVFVQIQSPQRHNNRVALNPAANTIFPQTYSRHET